MNKTAYSESTEIRDLVLQRVLREWRPEELGWDWASGLLGHALVLMLETKPDRPVERHLKRWMDFHIAAQTPVLDTGGRLWKIGPGVCALYFYTKTHQAPYQRRVEHILRYMDETPRLRTKQGQGLLTSKEGRSEIWVDSLMTLCPFWARAGRAGLAPDGVGEAEAQLTGHARCLRDAKTGLWFHAYDTQRQKPLGQRWSRGLGWALFAMVEVLDQMEPAQRRRSRLPGLLEESINAALQAQDEAGHWYTVMDRRDSFMETSGQAVILFALAKSLRLKLIPPARRKAVRHSVSAGWKVLRLHVTGQGGITGVTGGTSAGTYEHYMTRRVRGWLPWGEAALLLATHELTLAHTPQPLRKPASSR